METEHRSRITGLYREALGDTPPASSSDRHFRASSFIQLLHTKINLPTRGNRVTFWQPTDAGFAGMVRH
jgi:hypothetical protein